MFLWLFLVFLASCAEIKGNENLIQINFKKTINEISDKYVSFSIDPKYLLSSHYTRYLSNATENIFDRLGPAYIRLNMSPELKFHEGSTLEEVNDINRIRQIEFGIEEWKSLHKWTQQHKFTAVIQLDYDSSTWKPRDTLRLLGVANDIGIKDCVWQLGSELNDTGIKKYIDDFKAFETMIKIFPEEKTHWKVIPANLRDQLTTYDTSTTFNELKDVIYSTVWQQEFHHTSNRHQNYFANKDTSLKYLLKHEPNVWLNVISRPLFSSKGSQCASLCIQDGLQWAQILGDAANTGFKSVFKPIVKRDLLRPTFTHHITRLFKHLIGSKVFSVTGLKGDRFTSHYYGFCSRNQTNGGFVLMMVNSGETRVRTEFSLTFRYKKSVIKKYVLTVCDGHVCLNDNKFDVDTEIVPVTKKKNFKRSILLSIPPQSVAFYEFPYANVRLCEDLSSSEEETDSHERKSERKVTKLLKDLAFENLNYERREIILPRIKRQLAFKELNLFKPLNKLTGPPPPPHAKKNNGKILLVNKPEKTKIHGIGLHENAMEEEIFQSSENQNLPRGEMYLFVGNERQAEQESNNDYDYVEFDQSGPTKTAKKEKNSYVETEDHDDGVREESVEVESIDKFNDFGGEFIRPAANKRKPTKKFDGREINEIAASKNPTGYKRKSANQQKDNTQYAVLVKELAPTVRQNKLHRKKAQKKVAQLALGDMEETKVDKNEDVEVETDDYEYFNEDDARFFSSDEHEGQGDKKKRNSVNTNHLDAGEKPENKRFMKALEKLLVKIEKKVTESHVHSDDKNYLAVRTRRSIASGHIPKRKARKSLRSTETGKEISRATPIDIENIKERSINALKKKRSLALTDVEANFYEVANELDSELGAFDEPIVYVKQLKHFNIEPSTNDFNISAEFMIQPKMIEKTEATTEFTTTIVTPVNAKPSMVKISGASVFNGFVQPILDLYRTVMTASKDLMGTVFTKKVY